MHAKTPVVTRLAVQLPGEQLVIFNDTDNIRAVADRPVQTTLAEWFTLNSADESARSVLYCDMPTNFVYSKANKAWKKRVVHKKMPTIGRVASCSPAAGERFYLRLLLHHVTGAQSFAGLRTHEGRVYATFKEAAQAHGLLEYDNEWDARLREAASWSNGRGLRQLFATILLHNEPARPDLLWQKYREAMTYDILLQARQVRNQTCHRDSLDESAQSNDMSYSTSSLRSKDFNLSCRMLLTTPSSRVKPSSRLG